MQTSNFYFKLDPTSDSIDAICNLATGGMNGYTLAAQMPGIFWIEQDVNGNDCLCMRKVVGADCPLLINGTTTVFPIPFVAIPDQSNIFGTHPTVLFKPGPRK